MYNKLLMNWNRIKNSPSFGVPARDEGKRGRESWAEQIKSYEAVPTVFKDFFSANGAPDLPYMVLTPSFEGFIRPMKENLVCDFGQEILVLARNGNTFDMQCYPLEKISYIEVKTILLNSSIKICGITKEGVPSSSTFGFNTVTDYLFKPIVQKMRYAAVDIKGAVQPSELEKFDPWMEVNYKFMSYARRCLLPGEEVTHLFLQPEIRKTIFKFLGKVYDRVIFPPLASILTDRELIMIREEKLRNRGFKYGGVWDFIPLKKILTLSLAEKNDNLLALTVHLTEGDYLEFVFQASKQKEIHRLQYRFQELMIT